MMPLEIPHQTSMEPTFSPLGKELGESARVPNQPQPPTIPANQPGKSETEEPKDHTGMGNVGNVGNMGNNGNIGNVEIEGGGEEGKKEIGKLVEDVEKKGFFLSLEGPSLRVKPSGLPADLRKELQERKEEVVSFLSSRSHPCSSNPSFPEVLSTADTIVSELNANDPDRRHLVCLIDQARRSAATEDDLSRLAFALIDVYARKFNPDYRAAIWGGRTWREVNAKGGRP